MIKPYYWKNNSLYLLEQKRLPDKEIWIKCSNHKETAKAIKEMVVRGAPAIGVTAAYGMALGIRLGKIKEAEKVLKESRPTAVNLFWAVERVKEEMAGSTDWKKALGIAMKIEKEDLDLCRSIGTFGARLIRPGSRVLTHCNAGGLATSGWGTALGIVRSARDKIKMVWVDETRPYLQGARLTAWELEKEKIPYRVIADNMAGYLMKKGEVDLVIAGADRIASNGDTANKIGTYSLAVLCSYHLIPFYIAAPYSTFDLRIRSGREIPIEERNADELKKIQGILLTPRKAKVFNPSFDVTPHELITAIITEKGVIKNPDASGIKKLYR